VLTAIPICHIEAFNTWSDMAECFSSLGFNKLLSLALHVQRFVLQTIQIAFGNGRELRLSKKVGKYIEQLLCKSDSQKRYIISTDFLQEVTGHSTAFHTSR